MPDLLQNGQLVLHGPVNAPGYGPNSFTSRDVLAALAEHGDKPITVPLNCPGGDAFEGVAIYNALARHPAMVTIVIEGLAASAGSLIAMAGGEIEMAAGSMLMLHEAYGVTVGPAEAQTKQAALLDKLSAQYASIYAARSGGDPEAVRAAMKDETWFSAEEAVAAGYATRIGAAKAKPAAAFDYRLYAKAPDALVALAARNNWTALAAGGAPASADIDALRAEIETLKADAAKRDQALAYEASRIAAGTGSIGGLARPGRARAADGRVGPRGPINFNDFVER